MITAPLLPLRAFNRDPQSCKLGFTFADAYIFAGNVANAKASQSRLLQTYGFTREVTDLISSICSSLAIFSEAEELSATLF